MKRLASGTAVALATLVCAVAVWKLRYAGYVLLGTIAFSSAVEPAIRLLERLRLPRWLSVALVNLLGFGVASGALYLAFAALPVELARAADEATRLYGLLRARLPSHGGLGGELTAWLPDPAAWMDGAAASSGGALGLTEHLMSAVGTSGIIFVLSLFWSASAHSIERLVLSLLSLPVRARARETWRALRDCSGVQLRALALRCIVVIPLAVLLFRLAGAPFPVLAALTVGVLQLVPLVGPILCVVVALLSGEAHGLLAALICGAGTILLVAWLRPLVSERLAGARRENPVLVGVTLMALWNLAGPYALIGAAPLAALLAVTIDHLFIPPSARPHSHDLHEAELRLAELEAAFAQLPSERPGLASVKARLSTLLRDAESEQEAHPLH